MALRIGASRCKLASCLVSFPWVFCRWKYSIFDLSRDLCQQVFKGLCKFMDEILSRRVTTLPSLMAIGLLQVEI